MYINYKEVSFNLIERKKFLVIIAIKNIYTYAYSASETDVMEKY